MLPTSKGILKPARLLPGIPPPKHLAAGPPPAPHCAFHTRSTNIEAPGLIRKLPGQPLLPAPRSYKAPPPKPRPRALILRDPKGQRLPRARSLLASFAKTPPPKSGKAFVLPTSKAVVGPPPQASLKGSPWARHKTRCSCVSDPRQVINQACITCAIFRYRHAVQSACAGRWTASSNLWRDA